eukprot:scaffold3735_cov82-Cyclotella_meneghiniana.AAC.3
MVITGITVARSGAPQGSIDSGVLAWNEWNMENFHFPNGKCQVERSSSNNRWKAGQQMSSSWYSSHAPEGYSHATYEQFCNGNYFGTIEECCKMQAIYFCWKR